MQVALRDQVLQQIDEGSTGICTGVQMDHIVGTTELKERLRLQNREDQWQWGHRREDHETDERTLKLRHFHQKDKTFVKNVNKMCNGTEIEFYCS